MTAMVASVLFRQSLNEPEFRVSCGASALQMLLKLSDQPRSLEEVESALPASDQGSSLQDLVVAAKGFGLSLRGCRLNSSSKRPQKPFIVLLKPSLGGNGHFVVVRPLAKTDSVQIVDSQTYPKVVSWKNLFDAPVWQGVALVQGDNANGRTSTVLYAALGLGVGLIGFAFLIRRTETKLTKESVV